MSNKTYTIRHDYYFCGREYQPTYHTGTINELIKAFEYPLTIAKGYGLNCNYQPKTIKALLKTLTACFGFIHSCEIDTIERVSLVDDQKIK